MEPEAEPAEPGKENMACAPAAAAGRASSDGVICLANFQHGMHAEAGLSLAQDDPTFLAGEHAGRPQRPPLHPGKPTAAAQRVGAACLRLDDCLGTGRYRSAESAGYTCVQDIAVLET